MLHKYLSLCIIMLIGFVKEATYRKVALREEVSYSNRVVTERERV